MFYFFLFMSQNFHRCWLFERLPQIKLDYDSKEMCTVKAEQKLSKMRQLTQKLNNSPENLPTLKRKKNNKIRDVIIFRDVTI